MVRRRQFDVFFILYLCALAVFVIVSRERDEREQRLRGHQDAVVRAFIPPLRISADSLVHVYVDSDESGSVSESTREYRTLVMVDDIGSEDSVEVSLISVAYNNTLMSPASFRVLERQGVGELRDMQTSFPVVCRFDRTGEYAMRLAARARRVHPDSGAQYRYRSTTFGAEILDAGMLARLESAQVTLRFIVEDTSLSADVEWLRMRSSVTTPQIVTARGYEVRNEITVTHALPIVSARIVQGFGAMSRHSHSASSTVYRWYGTPSRATDTVVAEFRCERSGRVVDVHRARFVVNTAEPFLDRPVPDKIYAGEDIECTISVAGLTDLAAYSWQLSELTGNGQEARKDSGTGAFVRYHLPNNFAGKTIRIRAFYHGRPYRHISPRSFQAGPSVFSFSVVDPPTNISIDIPARPRVSDPLFFTARMFKDRRYEFDRPVASLKAVKVELWRIGGVRGFKTMDNIPAPHSLLSQGRFRIDIKRSPDTLRLPARVLLRIKAQDAAIEREFTLYE